MRIDKFRSYARIKNCISCDQPVCSYVHILNIAQKKIDFPSPNAEAAFVNCFILAFESNMKQYSSNEIICFRFLAAFYHLQRMHSFDATKPFLFQSMTFVTYFYNQTFKSKTRFKRLCSHVILTCQNASCCSQTIIYICIV